MKSDQTLDFYNQNADDFISRTVIADMESARTRFTACLPPNASILDFGCGSGRDTKSFLDAGYRVDAMDGSQALCEKASAYTGIQVKMPMTASGPAHPFSIFPKMNWPMSSSGLKLPLDRMVYCMPPSNTEHMRACGTGAFLQTLPRKHCVHSGRSHRICRSLTPGSPWMFVQTGRKCNGSTFWPG